MNRRWGLIIGGIVLIGLIVLVALLSLSGGAGDTASTDQIALQADDFYGTVTAVVGDDGREVAQVVSNTPAPALTSSAGEEVTSADTPTDTPQPSATLSATQPAPPVSQGTANGTQDAINDNGEILSSGTAISGDIGSAFMTREAMTAEAQNPVATSSPEVQATFEQQSVPTPIGEGSFVVYAPEEARQGDTILVELELDIATLFDETAGTNGEEPSDSTEEAEVEAQPRATFTPVAFGGNLGRTRVQGVGENRVPVYPLMGASITCPPQSFNGCEDGVFMREIVPERGQENWLWLLSANQDASGNQPMFIEVFRVIGFDNGAPVLQQFAGPYRFQISVISAATTNLTPLVLALVGVLAVIGAGVFVWRGRKSTPPTKHAVTFAGDKPYIFLSYRRGASWSLARSIANSLEERGAEVFLDVDDINEGRFADILENAIKRCDYFVPILAPTTLDSVWCRREIAFALEQKKTIIPLLSEGYAFDAGSVPAEIQDIASHNAITILPEFYEAAVDRLARRFIKLEE